MRRASFALLAIAFALGALPYALAQTPPTNEDGSEDESPTASVTASASGSAKAPRPGASGAASGFTPHITVPQKDGMLRIPGGRFTMGSNDRAAAPNEKPPHLVNVAPFWIDRTEVTVAAYRACVEGHGCAPPQKTSASCTYDQGEPLLPISCVRWQDADHYCRASGKRLPREAEWELAARGTGSMLYPWGNSPPSCGVAATLARDTTATSCSGKRPAKVGSHGIGASPYGVHDLIGNVEEWVADWYVESPGTAPRAGSSHVLRGGGWLSGPSQSRATSRNWGSSVEAGPNVGFRCARDPAPGDPTPPTPTFVPAPLTAPKPLPPPSGPAIQTQPPG